MKFNHLLIPLLITLFVEMGNSRKPHPDKVQSLHPNRQERQNDIFNQFLSSIHGILGQTTTTKSPNLLDDVQIPSQAPNQSRKPGTTNNGGIVNQIVATASGISSGLFGVLGVNTGPNVVAFLNYRTSPRPTSIGIGNNNVPGSNNGQLGDLSIGDNKTNSLFGQENIFSSLHFPSPAPILDIVGEIFGKRPGPSAAPSLTESCSEIHRLLGQCK